MTTILLFAILIFVAIKAVRKTGKVKTVRLTATPPKRAKLKPEPASLSLYKRTKTLLFGEKAVIVHLFRDSADGEIQHQTSIRVQWLNSTVCHHPDDGLRYSQFLMLLENGKRITLTPTEKDGKNWVTYQDQPFNRWDCEVCVRHGLLSRTGLTSKGQIPASVWTHA
ncbi:MAG: hypothetical protein QJT81_14135 [Candidatus Thiothrix putei]|uniref:Uncharacterized protein n=2 Tax=Thiothrix TaxID=1030 RepID=A0A1H4DUJ3_9GAMM|nr:hypothetical protein [Thiothrix caldifontis]WGZ92961.1 MAG: hypothetical protein QJT81_14135 [Candidatus Thiothrix putei]SEA76453.1 hypothetical protein SAMN05660964_02369 [Thiothrix caldifontis]